MLNPALPLLVALCLLPLQASKPSLAQELVEVLLLAGSDPNLGNHDGLRPLDLACRFDAHGHLLVLPEAVGVHALLVGFGGSNSEAFMSQGGSPRPLPNWGRSWTWAAAGGSNRTSSDSASSIRSGRNRSGLLSPAGYDRSFSVRMAPPPVRLISGGGGSSAGRSLRTQAAAAAAVAAVMPSSGADLPTAGAASGAMQH